MANQTMANRESTICSAQCRLGFAGLGVMGEPMCHNLMQKAIGELAVSMLVYDLKTEPVERLVQAGALRADSIHELASSVDILFLSLPGGPEVEQLVLGADGVLSHAKTGLTIVDLSTSPVKLTRELATKARTAGIRYLDSPVARTREAAISGTLAMMVGASDEDYALIKPYLECMASDVSHCGDVGAGQIVKILNNMVLFQTVLSLAEALTMARRAGLDGEVLFDALEKGSADSFALRNHGRKALLTSDFPMQAFSTHYASKDLDYALQLASETATTTQGAETVRKTFEKTIESGFGENYWPALLEIINQQESVK